MWVRRVHPMKRRMKRSPLDGCGSVAGHRLPPVAISWVALHPSFHLLSAWRIGKLAFIPSFVFSSSIVGKWGEIFFAWDCSIGMVLASSAGKDPICKQHCKTRWSYFAKPAGSLAVLCSNKDLSLWSALICSEDQSDIACLQNTLTGMPCALVSPSWLD